MHFVMRLRAPFDFQKAARMYTHFRNSLPDTYDEGCYKRALHVNKRPILVSVSSQGTTANPRLNVQIYPPLKRSELAMLKRQLQRMFEPSFDFREFYSVAKKDPFMRKVAEKVRGLSPIRPSSIFESVIIAITEQQISLNAAMAIRSRLVEKYGDRVVLNAKTFHAFPTPDRLAKARLQGLRSVGLSSVKSNYIVEFSKKVASGKLDLESLTELTDEQVIDELTQLKGIGRWTAEYVLVRGMGRVNSLPADDLGIRRAVSRAYFAGKSVSADEARTFLTRRFSPYAGIAAFYLMYYLYWEDPFSEKSDDRNGESNVQVADL